MAKPLEGGIAKIIAKALRKAKLLKSATLTKVAQGIRGPTLSAGTNPTSTSYSAKGIVSEYSAYQIDGTLIMAGDRKVTLFGATIAGRQVPAPNDQITIEGATYTIVKDGVRRDAASATYVCQCRA